MEYDGPINSAGENKNVIIVIISKFYKGECIINYSKLSLPLLWRVVGANHPQPGTSILWI